MLLHGPKAGKSGAASNDVHFGMLRPPKPLEMLPNSGLQSKLICSYTSKQTP
jgi:hypothetical protein